MELYKEQLLDHYKNPRNTGKLENPDFSSGMVNPSCGDSLMMQGIVKEGILDQIKFTGTGCVISQATASMLTQMVKGKSLESIQKLEAQDMLDLLHISLGPLRIQCALLSLQALKKGLLAYTQSTPHAG